MEYHTLRSLYDELKTKPEDAFIRLNLQHIQYYRASPPEYKRNLVEKTESWNILEFTYPEPKSRVKAVCEFLEPFLADHGTDIISAWGCPIKTGTHFVEIPLQLVYMSISKTHLNTTRDEPQVQAELDKLAELVDVDIVVKWLSKKVAPDRTVYLVENRYFIGVERLKLIYPLYNDSLTEKVFRADESLPNLLVCRASQVDMARSFQPKTEEMIETEILKSLKLA